MENSKSVNKTINVSVARNARVPCLWERGGYDVNKKKGYAIIVCNSKGEKKISIAQREEINNRHALIPIEIGDICIEAIKDDYNRTFEGKTCINVWKISQISVNQTQLFPIGDCLLELINNFCFDIWIDKEQAESIKVAIEAAERKVTTIDCNFLFYAHKRASKNKR